MPDKRYKVEGVVTIHFEIETDADAIGCWGDVDLHEIEQEAENFIEADPSELFCNGAPGIHVAYREDRVEITDVREIEPNWGKELTKVVAKAEREVLTKVIEQLPEDAKKKIVLAIEGTDDEDED
jgi:hypothetical protein